MLAINEMVETKMKLSALCDGDFIQGSVGATLPCRAAAEQHDANVRVGVKVPKHQAEVEVVVSKPKATIPTQPSVCM